MAGKIGDINTLKKICKNYKLKLIEDCAHSLGSTFNEKHAGTFGDFGVFSFYPTKQITTGEGGIVITNNLKLINKIKSLKSFGINTLPQERKIVGLYDVKNLGFHYRMTDFQAAIGFKQLSRYKKELNTRLSNAKLLHKYLSSLSNIFLPSFSKNDSYFIFQIFFNSVSIRKKISELLKNKKIGHSVHYMTPVPLMSYYKRKYKFTSKDFPVSTQYGKLSISLPIHGDLTKKDIYRIYDTIKNGLK